MTEQEANKEVCLKFFRHLASREFEDALACVADDIVWWVQGDTAGSGFRYGKDSLFPNLKRQLRENLQISFGHLTAEEDRVALEMKSQAVLANGRAYANTYHFLLTLKNGLICNGKEYLDTKHLSEVMYSSGSK